MNKKSKKTICLSAVSVLALVALDQLTKYMAVLFEILYSTGIRVSEASNIKLTDIDRSSLSIRIFGKGSKERIAYYGKVAERLLNKYLGLPV